MGRNPVISARVLAALFGIYVYTIRPLLSFVCFFLYR